MKINSLLILIFVSILLVISALTSVLIKFNSPIVKSERELVFPILMKEINNVGCIFVGEYSSEAFGDYIIGTNHILPTSGSAKFSSGLGVLDFMKRNSIVEINKSAYSKLHLDVEQMAEVEKFDAHKLSV